MRPQTFARLTGSIYLLYFLTAASAEAFIGRSRPLAFDVVTLIAYSFYVALTILLYFMFRPVNRNISLLAALFSLAGCASDVLNLFKAAPFKVSGLAFFGPYCALIGYLIFQSGFLPRLLGVLMVLAGVGWLIFLTPLAIHLSTYLKILGILAEASLMLWLIVKGVNVGQWRPQVKPTNGTIDGTG